MPSEDTGISWAEQVEQGEDDSLPPPHEDFDQRKGVKTVTEYKINDNGKKVRVVKTFKVETKKFHKSIARRKAWIKFGGAERDPPGPNPANTIISEEVYMQFVHSKDATSEENKDADPLSKLKGQKMVACRICKGDHWTTRCPYKDSLAPISDMDKKEDTPPAAGEEGDPKAAGGAAPKGGGTAGKYVPPSMRDGGNKRGESMTMSKRGDEVATIRVTNLSEDTRESDLQELFRPFGNISRIYLAKDKITGQSKGFAFINFHRREDAARAIAGVSGFGYDHLILNVEWAKPSGDKP